MSDIGIKGVVGFIVLGGTTILGVLAVVIASISAFVVTSRREVPVGPSLGRMVGGPLASTAVAVASLGWSWDRASDVVDELSPVLALARILVGVVCGVLLRRSSRRRRETTAASLTARPINSRAGAWRRKHLPRSLQRLGREQFFIEYQIQIGTPSRTDRFPG